MAKQDYSALQDLKAAIKAKNPERLYFFHGEEMFLLRHYLGQVKKILVDELTESFNFHRFTDETFDVQSFADAVENLPMMADFTMVQVDDIDLFKLAETERNKIVEIISDIPQYCSVVFTYQTVAWKPDKRQKALWEAVSGGQIVEFSKQEQRELISWIIRHFAALNKRITPDLCAYLIDITDGTMTSIGSEIKKIASYSGADDICKADIDAVTEPVPDAVAFQMANDISAGRYDNAIVKLQQLLKMQEEPLGLLGTIGMHFRRIGVARTLLDNGKGTQDLMKICGMTDYAARKTMDSARRFSPELCKKAAELILETDRKIKTSFDAPQRLLEILILQLAQEVSR